MKIRKIEWHQVSSYYETEINEDLLSEIYPDMESEEITELLADLESGEADIETVLDDAGWDVAIEWDHKDDDWWTHRKGGYDVTYEVLESEEEGSTDTVDEDADILAGLDELVATWDAMSDEEKEEFKETMRSQYSSKCECSICAWSGNSTDAVERDNALYCPECDSPVILTDDKNEE